MMKDFWEYSVKNIKKQLIVKETPVAVINASYPEFEPKQGKQGTFILKINKFYKYTAEKYADYIFRKYSSKASRKFESNGRIKLSFLMNFTVSYSAEDVLSVFTDLSYFDGTGKRTVRFSQNWSAEHMAILPPSMCFETGRKWKSLITGTIAEIAAENMKRHSFNYFSGYEMLIKRKFDFDNFYFVPNGTAFFYNAGVLSDECDPSVFVVPDEITGRCIRTKP